MLLFNCQVILVAANTVAFVEDYLYWLLGELQNWIEVLGWRCDLAVLFQEIELLFGKDQKEKDRLTPSLLGVISDLTLLTEVQRQLRLLTFRECPVFTWSDEEEQVYQETSVVLIKKIHDDFLDQTRLAPLVPDLRVFDYPSDKPRTAITTAQMRSAERTLDDFWANIDELCVSKTGKSPNDIIGDWTTSRDVERTPEWATNIKKESTPESYDVHDALARLVERTERTIESPPSMTIPREKPKTRSLAADNTQDQINTTGADGTRAASAELDTTGISSSKIPVKKKAFNTFAALFGTPVADTLPGELPWHDFKKAMVHAGFGAQKLQGSAWLFASEKGNIIFHEPHPESKLPMQWARRIARRLKRNFGWTMDTFVPEGDVGGKTTL
ncbi:MAG: hypothetical protein Q9226_004193 [Calogaya cf. arnoldii]